MTVGADETKQPALNAANGQGVVGIKPEPTTDPSPADRAAPAQAAPEQASRASVPVKAESEVDMKQEVPVPAINGAPAVKTEPLNGASRSAGLVAPAQTAAAVSTAHQQTHKLPEKTAQSADVKAEPDAKGEASMQNGAPAARPAEDLREEGTAHTGHESEEESDLEDEEEEHENQVRSFVLLSPGKLGRMLTV